LDSCVLIRHLRRHPPATDLVSQLALEGRLGIATITRVEIIQGMREREREGTMRLLDSLLSYPLNATVADLTGELIRRHRASGMTLDKPDAIIGATAILHDMVLVTYNSRHFPMSELRLYQGLSEAP
jgi:predicted nucleic acid-binding protein